MTDPIRIYVASLSDYNAGRPARCLVPPKLLAKQPDDTTHVCLYVLGGCNNGFALDHQPEGATP